MLVRYFKQFSKLPLYTPHSYKASFIHNFLKKQKADPKASAQTQQTQADIPPQTQANEEPKNTATGQENMNLNQEFTPQIHQQPEAEYEVAIEPKSRVAELQEKLDLELDLPYKLYGTQAKVEVKTGYMGDRIFTFHKIPKEFVTNHLMKIYTGCLYSMAAKDEEFLNEYLEKYLSERLLQSLTKLSQQGYLLKVIKDVSGVKGDPVQPKMDIVDMVVVKGLNISRDENKGETAYHKYVDIEDMGLVIYTPLELTDPSNFIDPKKNQTMYDEYAKVLIRLLVEIESPLKLVITRPNGEEILLDNELKTFKHTAIFESQMKPPPKFTNINKMENYMEWLGKFKFGAWKMADLDNWMLGNPLIKEDNTREKYKDAVFKGSKYDVEAKIDLKKI